MVESQHTRQCAPEDFLPFRQMIEMDPVHTFECRE